ncbi:RNA polymerase sigma factor RpoE [Caulifigura coniformis]|uniref:RNA polymerase sigma factor RpoE n=1 Tax=Caulifigura coniformis TaxID=2527983 RepID=A0A517SMP9_9PLAN|nr:RNA polymerase sigma factor RpoE [Caulifigura coniformis]
MTAWVERLRHGDRAAGDLLDVHFRDALVRAARSRFANVISAAADEDDLVQSVFHAVWSAAVHGSLTEVRDRDPFWGLLLTITRNKAISRRRKERARTHAGGRADQFSQLGDGAVVEAVSTSDMEVADEVIAGFLEEQERLLLALQDEPERQVAIYKLQGLSHPGIAALLEVSVRTVERKLALIRQGWMQIRTSLEGRFRMSSRRGGRPTFDRFRNRPG